MLALALLQGVRQLPLILALQPRLPATFIYLVLALDHFRYFLIGERLHFRPAPLDPAEAPRNRGHLLWRLVLHLLELLELL